MEGTAYISKRFALSRFLGLTEEEMRENERLWREEQGDADNTIGSSSLRSAGLTPGGLGSDLDNLGGGDADLDAGGDADAGGGDAEGGDAGGDAGGEGDISI